MRRTVAVAFIGWVWARVCVGAGFWVAHLLTPTPSMAARQDFPLPKGLLSWDGFFYRLIAEYGYVGTPKDGARFFPLYPLIGRTLAPLVGGREDVALLVINNAAALVGTVLLAQLAREVLADVNGGDRAERVAIDTTWIIAVIPAALVFVFAYTEGLALCFTAAALLALHRRAFVWVGVFAALAAGLRPTGLLLGVPILIEIVRVRPRPLRAVASLVGPVLGFLASAWFIQRTTGNWFAPLDEQRPIRGDFRNPVIRVLESGWGLFHNTDTELVPFVVLWGLLLLVSIRRRQPWSWIAFSTVTLMVALSADTIDSIGRYGMLAVPLVIALAQWADRRWRTTLVAVVGSVGLVIYTAQALQGRIVP